MTNPPGEGEQPQYPSQPAPGEPAGYWEQQARQGGYGYPSPYPPQGYVPEHPKATTCLVLGILGIVLCQVLAPFALVMGRRTVDEIDASGGRVGGRGSAQTGYVLGIVGTVLLGLGLLWIVFLLITMGIGLLSVGTR